MTRVLALAQLAPTAALAQTAVARDAAPLAPVWIAVSLVVVAALLALLLIGPTRAAHSGDRPRR